MIDRLIVGVGYVGRPLAEFWRSRGLRVAATTRRRERFDELRSSGLEPVCWDVLGEENDPLPSVEVVVYSVGNDRASGRSMRETYVDGLRRTLDALPKPGRFLYLSSTGVYGDSAGAWVDEATPPAPTDPSGEVCLEAEGLLQQAASVRGIAWNILRLAGIYGPGRIIGAADLRAGKPVGGDPEAMLNLIHVDDIVTIVDAVARRGEPNSVYCVSDGNPVVRREFYSHLATLLDAPEPNFDASAGRRARGNRRVSNGRVVGGLGVELKHPSYREGLAAIAGS